jgi:molybdopterin-containing oxidoreductase family iron-sulfur binding subunit
MSPGTAERLGVKNEDVVTLNYRGRSLRAAVWLLPGHAPDSVTLHLGYGQPTAEPEATGGGFNAYALRFADAPWFDTGLELARTGETYALAATQHHHLIEGRDLLRAGTLQQYLDHPNFAQATEGQGTAEAPASLYPEYPYPDKRWGMVIDLSACTGCNACVIACQAENNVPVVGKDQVRRGREMHWLRVDSYFFGEPDAPAVNFQPVPCMHCEKAPCEPVCPVAATVHSSDGLNEMIYNRCIGTRYCSNNCPYKVRRFNFLDFPDFDPPEHRQMLANPDVSVRSRGVMEKCTYCVQRIRAAQGAAEAAGRPLADGEVITACQGACPAQAIVFGDLNQPDSLAAQGRANPRNYALLGELGTQPRTTYLAALRNPNPELE